MFKIALHEKTPGFSPRPLPNPRRPGGLPSLPVHLPARVGGSASPPAPGRPAGATLPRHSPRLWWISGPGARPGSPQASTHPGPRSAPTGCRPSPRPAPSTLAADRPLGCSRGPSNPDHRTRLSAVPLPLLTVLVQPFPAATGGAISGVVLGPRPGSRYPASRPPKFPAIFRVWLVDEQRRSSVLLLPSKEPGHRAPPSTPHRQGADHDHPVRLLRRHSQ
jgi:hypothetical protein